MSTTLTAGDTAYVVRDRDSKFVRAFLSFKEALSYTDGAPRWNINIETATEPDDNGGIFPLYPKGNNQ